MASSIQVARPINRIRDIALAKFDVLIDELSTPEEQSRRAVMASPAYQWGVLSAQFQNAMEDIAAALSAGFADTRRRRP